MHHLSKSKTRHLEIVLADAVQQILVTGGYSVYTFFRDLYNTLKTVFYYLSLHRMRLNVRDACLSHATCSASNYNQSA